MVRLFMARSHLMHSRWFVRWFSSPYYLARAGMKVTWHRDPVSCWEMAKYYMEEGYDQFGTDQLSAHVYTHFRLAERFIILIRLCKLARGLELFGLMESALTVLKQTDHLVSPANVVTLARYIFGGEDYCENIPPLRKWCLKMIHKHYDWLIKSDQWVQVVRDSVPDLEEQWRKVTTSKRAVSREDLKRLSQQNLRDAKILVESATIEDQESEGSMKHDCENVKGPPPIPFTPKKEIGLTKSTQEEEETPTKKPKAKKSLAEMTILQQIHSLRKNMENDGGLSVESLQAASPARNSSLCNTVEGQDSVSNKFGERLRVTVSGAPLARKSSFREVFELDTSNSTIVDLSGEVHPGEAITRMTDMNRRPGAGALSTSISAPILTPRRFGDMSKHLHDDPFDSREYSSDIVRPASEGAVTAIKAQDGSFSQRGVIVTVGAANEPDSWPLADIPLPDPLLPYARRPPSLDSGSTIREHFRASTHHAQAVTIFGIHRPGMGGSIITIDENEEPKESEKRSPNHAKAREFLGIDAPAIGSISRPKSRAVSDAEVKKLKKKNPWLGILGE